MKTIPGLTINESHYDLADNKKGTIAVFIFSGDGDPAKVLDYAVREYVESNGYHELIDANLDNPWMRVVMSDINDMRQASFDLDTHKLVKQ
ncbi:hypothetical protein [Mucilaginibacter psychrotolerans]|uniref:Uncharacterized protein n=1 Tax=Mucilaginibacter psychrotolerans TaxID=1524096 RepID=A0A4Y8SP09_9SPHI|nr:hypothetical protein [Mucilaginibacter psychrotolerans]TFF40632.1 hypothetical protein E2R66_00150 [Mucilaginibacter psychrotolerans]